MTDRKHKLLDGGRAYGPGGRLADKAPARCKCGWISEPLDSVGARRMAFDQHLTDSET
jgi:hypothetical protein